MAKFQVAVLPGDGIGPEVMEEATKILKLMGDRFSHQFELHQALIGGEALDEVGDPLPPETLSLCKKSLTVLLGPVGGGKWDSLPPHQRPEEALLTLRSELGVFANLRPIVLYKPLTSASPLKEEIIGGGIDILMVREFTGGLYFGHPRGRCRLPDGTAKAINTVSYTEKEIKRVAHTAFNLARERFSRLTSVDKANLLETSQLWREVLEKVGKSYPDVKLNHLYIDSCAMELVRDPHQFDVIVTENLFGDILSREAAMLTGSIGMLGSASLGEGKYAIYEPVHGSCSDIAGKNMANPLAMILCVSLMFRFTLRLKREAWVIEEAVRRVLKKGYRTCDIQRKRKKPVGTTQMGEAVRKEINNICDSMDRSKEKSKRSYR